jgi:hypothetical protein
MGLFLRGGRQGYGHISRHGIIRAIAVRSSHFFTGPNGPCLVIASFPSRPLARRHVRVLLPSQEAHVTVVRESAQFPTSVREVCATIVHVVYPVEPGWESEDSPIGQSPDPIPKGPGDYPRSLWPSNVVCKATFPRVFDLTNRVTTSFTSVGNEAYLTLKWMTTGSADHLVGLEEEGRGNGEAQRLGGL